MSKEKSYLAIDLKSFYASVECVERGLDPMTTNLVVADQSRTEKTICLAVSPSLKSYGIAGRARLFEVVRKVAQINAQRKAAAPGGRFSGSGTDILQLKADPSLKLDYIVATPRMAYYMEYSTRIYQIYLNYIAPEDIHVYSIDEVFLDVTGYLDVYGLSAYELAGKLIREVLQKTGITATAGIGTNLYLCKVAMDIEAKHIPPDSDNLRIAFLDEMTYRQKLWSHTPLTDFWRIGPGYARKLAENGMFTMGDVARRSLEDEALLYRLFGVNAELLIDHAWGWEPCTIADIKAYRPENSSISSGQVLQSPYDFEKGKLVVCEMTEQLALDLVEKGLTTDQIMLTVGYDTECLKDPHIRRRYRGPVTRDRYQRETPKAAHGSRSLAGHTASARLLLDAVTELYERIVDKNLLVRRMYVVANHVVPEQEATAVTTYEQMELFVDDTEKEKKKQEENERLAKERNVQNAVLSIKKKYGNNAIFKGRDLKEGATGLERNRQIGGHKA